MFWTILLIILGIVVALPLLILFIQVRLKKNYWKKRDFYSVDSSEIGGAIENTIRNIPVTDLDLKFYKLLKDKKQPFAGFLEAMNPAVLMTDLELLRQIFVKDFDHFVDRRDFISSSKHDKWTSKMLFFLEGEEWKELRSKMSPTFTTGKIRRMFKIFDDCGERFVGFLKEEIKTTPKINLSGGYGKYAIDVIASTAFGIESHVFNQKKSVFEKMAETLQIKMTFRQILKFIMIFFAPKISNLLKLVIFDQEACNFFGSTISNVLRHREKTGEKREDFLQLMLEARSGKLKEEEVLDAFEKDAIVKGSGNSKLTEEVIGAQSILFFLAGFDTTQTLLQFASYQLAISPEIQEKLYQEVCDSFTSNDDKFTYESVNEMEYMDKFISETLRMYPPAIRLERRCTKDYKIPGTDSVIPAGIVVIIPTYAIHHDENIFPEPSRFNPERFSKESKGERSPYAFMPFGHGPRNCIGMRFALTESKVALSHLLMNFIFEPYEKTPIPMKFKNAGSLTPEKPILLNVKPRN